MLAKADTLQKNPNRQKHPLCTNTDPLNICGAFAVLKY
ncbi:hypothetical protein GARC_3673 [Paraglaciecola arctica BSs20135]|uniref:Uncharacterized protein n=1 Tax=Paraglaciecola arctica BSs20135 TaxID=493475 RepID=K6YR22_9ALTE|nr:hypothetical protein GARC_3673 [Paraglaciecola arctica BSs20135]